jgi:hypothetical protein
VREQNQGLGATGFSATTMASLQQVWQEKYQIWCKRPLEGKECIYVPIAN